MQGNYQSDYVDWMLSYNRTESMDASSRNGWAPAILTHLSVTSAYLLVIEAFMPDGVLNFQHQPRM